jgi:hypothetical protein
LCSYTTVFGSDRRSLPSNIPTIIIACNFENKETIYEQAETNLLLQETIYGNNLVLQILVVMLGVNETVPADNILLN